jgi:hypothetical protein
VRHGCAIRALAAQFFEYVKPTDQHETSYASRPTEYTDEIAETICDRIANHESLREICLDPTMPDKATILDWIARRNEFRDQYRNAREWAAERLADETLAIAFDTKGDSWVRVRRDGRMVTMRDRANFVRCGLRIKLRQWVAGRLSEKYS